MPDDKELFLTLYREAISLLQESQQLTEEMFTSYDISSDGKTNYLYMNEEDGEK